MKVALVQPHHNYADLAPPLCLGYLASWVRREIPEVEIKVIDLAIGVDLKKTLGIFEPDLIGVTGSTPIAGSQAQLLGSLKKDFPRARVIVGGPHASTVRDDLFEYDVDGVVIGEGEETFVEIIRQGGSPEGIPGVLTKQGMVSPRERIKDIDTIPFPDRRLFKLNRYKINGAMVTSRGCPYDCIFCAQSVCGKSWRGHSPDYVVEEIDYLVKNYGVSVVRWMEDNPVLNKKRILEICEKIHQRSLAKKIRVENNSGLRADLVDEEILLALKSVGMDVVWIGLESADEEVLKQVKKRVTLDQIEKAALLAKRLGFVVSLYVTVGMPGDTLEKNRKTLEFVKKVRADNSLLGVATPYPGTELKEWVNRYGRWIERDYKKWYGHIDVAEAPPFDTEEFPLEERLEAIRMWHNFIARQHGYIALRRPRRAIAYALRNRNVVYDGLKRIFNWRSRQSFH